MDDVTQQMVRDAVGRAKREANPPMHPGDFQQGFSEPVRLVSLADIDLIIGRHEELARDAGYQRGREQGRHEGANTVATSLAVQMTEAVNLIAASVSSKLDTMLQSVLADRGNNGARDRRTREEIRQEAEQVVAGARDVLDVLRNLPTLIEP